MSPSWRHRLLRHPLIRIVLALLAIAIPFAIVAIPFNVFVSTELSTRHAIRESCAGLFLGALLQLHAARRQGRVIRSPWSRSPAAAPAS